MNQRRRMSVRAVLPLFVAVASISLLIPSLHADPPCEPQWATGFAPPGLDGSVYALVTFDEGDGSALYAAGSFTSAAGVPTSRIAKWNGNRWSPLASGMNNVVFALTVFDDGSGPALYAGGAFTTADGVEANCVAKWNGLTWSPLGSGMNDPVWSLTVFDDGSGPALYAGGTFTMAGGAEARKVAKWNGRVWSSLGSGMSGGDSASGVQALAAFNDESGPALYAGGHFATAGGVPASRIAKWNGRNWSSLGSGMDGGSSPAVRALTVFDDGGGLALYVGGAFTTAGGESANRIAKWNGDGWSALGTGIAGGGAAAVYSLIGFDAGSGPVLCAGGGFDTAGGVRVNQIANWNGSSWSEMGTEMSGGSVRCLAVFDHGSGPTLYAGGLFSNGGHIAEWTGSSWSPLGSGMSGTNSSVTAFTVFDDGGDALFYAGGAFTIAGGVAANRVALWNGSGWSPLNSGLNNAIYALTVFDDGGGPALFAGGGFTSADGVPTKYLAKWNGANWSAVGAGIDGGWVFALTVFDDGNGPALFAGGAFDTAGGVAANYVAKWNGSNWSPLGSGMNDRVYALAAYDDGSGPALYAGGDFTIAGSAHANRIAKWSGGNWSPLGSGVSGGEFSSAVQSLAVFDDGSGSALYAGGDFPTAGGVAANYVAKWNGSSWAPLGGGMDHHVFALTVFNDGGGPALYAGGIFNTAGGVTVNKIAKWNGGAWSAMGSGLSGTSFPTVNALIPFDDGTGPALYAGGAFTAAGGVPSSAIAKWTGCPPACPGDIDGNQAVTQADLAILLANYGANVPPGTLGDLDDDGTVGQGDLAVLLANYGEVCD